MCPEAFINRESVLKAQLLFIPQGESIHGFSRPIGGIPPSFHADDFEVQNAGLGLGCVGKMQNKKKINKNNPLRKAYACTAISPRCLVFRM